MPFKLIKKIGGIITRRFQKQGFKTTLVWFYARGLPFMTGVPMVLNTSFHENEPVVCKPAEARACFLRTRMDMLVLGDWIVRRTSA